VTHKRNLIAFAAIITTAFTASAQEIYKDVDNKGVVEFSDHPSSGAKAIDVNPNVVDLAPVKPEESPPRAKKPSLSEQSEATPDTVTEHYYGDYEKGRERHRERKERMEHREKAVQLPENKETRRAPVQGGARHR
jgi:hypothetical protein